MRNKLTINKLRNMKVIPPEILLISAIPTARSDTGLSEVFLNGEATTAISSNPCKASLSVTSKTVGLLAITSIQTRSYFHIR